MHTILEKVDFRTAINYSFDLELNRVKKAKFSTAGVIGLMDKYQIVIEWNLKIWIFQKSFKQARMRIDVNQTKIAIGDIIKQKKPIFEAT